MKKVALSVFCVGFFVVCAFFSLGMLIPGASGAAEGAGEVPTPLYYAEDGSLRVREHFGDDFETYFAKSFAYRNEIVGAFSHIKANCFATGNDQVVVGKDGFLFFADTLDDYLGLNPMTQTELNAVADSLLAIQRYCAARGADFLFVCAPNKNTVYGDKMPSRYLAACQGDLDRLYPLLDERGVAYADLRAPLREAAQQSTVYHKKDTHWNGAGAQIAYRAMMTALGREPLDFSDCGPNAVHDFQGDLDLLLYPGELRYDDDTVYDFSGKYIYTGAYSTPMDMTITTRSGGQGSLLCFRDSFANALIGYLSSDFADVTYDRGLPFEIDRLESKPADCVIVEVAQRNLRNLIGCDRRISE